MRVASEDFVREFSALAAGAAGEAHQIGEAARARLAVINAKAEKAHKASEAAAARLVAFKIEVEEAVAKVHVLRGRMRQGASG